MRVTADSLSPRLDQGLDPLYLVFGAESLLVEEALDEVRQRAVKQGHAERLRFTVEAGFDWNQLVQQGQSLSLFSEKRLIELRMPTGRPGENGARALMDYVERGMSEDTILVIAAGPIDKRARNTKWFKAVEAAATLVECPAVPAARLADWIGRRMSTRGMRHEPEALQRLAHYVEGNLLAAAQEINLLALLYPDETITAELVEQVIADHARFNEYNLSDACLAGSMRRVVRILGGLKREQAVDPVRILWALARDVRVMCQLAAAVEGGARPDSLYQRYGIWSSRRGAVSAALQRLGRARWENVLRRIGRADLMAKGGLPTERGDIWEEIESIALTMCRAQGRRQAPGSA